MLSIQKCIPSISSKLYLSQIGTFDKQFELFRAAFYVYRNKLISKMSSLPTGNITPQFMLPTQLATVGKELTPEDIRGSSKLEPAKPSLFEAIYYELRIVLEITMLPRGISFVLGNPMKSISATYKFFKPNLCINPKMTGKRHLFIHFRNPTSRLQQTKQSLQS